MTQLVEYTAELTRSELIDGQVIWTAALRESPGVVAEGTTEQAALNELIALVGDIQARQGRLPVLALRTPAVQGWRWEGVGEGAIVYGADPIPEFA